MALDKLTLNLGLRWDYQTLTPNTKDALGPRVGFAWDPLGNARTVIRGGFGKNYETENLILGTTLIEAAVVANWYIFQTNEDLSGLQGRMPAIRACSRRWAPRHCRHRSRVPRPADGDSHAVFADEFINPEPTLENPDRVLSYVWSFSVGVKHELFTDLAVSADYVGNRGRDITSLIDINEPRVLPNGSRGRPGVSVFDRTAR